MTVIATTPAEIDAYRAIVLRSGMKLLAAGIAPSRGWTKSRAMKMAEQYTGKTYGRRDFAQALEDMVQYVADLRASRDAKPAN